MNRLRRRTGSPLLLLTCEHASHAWPSGWAELLKPPARILESHRGWDPGARELARVCADQTHAPLVWGRWSRLLVELNRSLHHPRLWSDYTRGLSAQKRQEILDAIYHPFRTEVLERLLGLMVRGGAVVHVSIHTFTPRMGGEVRAMDVGLLYDPRRPDERRFCRHWREAIRSELVDLRVRFNAPYRGSADGHTTALRKRFVARQYLGIELEVNQRYALAGGEAWSRLKRGIAKSLPEAMRAISN